MKKIATIAAIGAGVLWAQGKMAKDPSKRWVKNSGPLLVVGLVAGAYLLVK